MHRIRPAEHFPKASAGLFLWTGFLNDGLQRADNAAGNPGAAVPGRLRAKIVRFAVQDNGTPDDLRGRKSVGKEDSVGKAAACEQDGQVARVIRMLSPGRIIMTSRAVKGDIPSGRARGVFMNLKAEKTAIWNAAQGRGDDAAVPEREKEGLPPAGLDRSRSPAKRAAAGFRIQKQPRTETKYRSRRDTSEGQVATVSEKFRILDRAEREENRGPADNKSARKCFINLPRSFIPCFHVHFTLVFLSSSSRARAGARRELAGAALPAPGVRKVENGLAAAGKHDEKQLDTFIGGAGFRRKPYIQFLRAVGRRSGAFFLAGEGTDAFHQKLRLLFVSGGEPPGDKNGHVFL